MNFDRIVRTDIAADESGVLATMRFDEEAIRDMAGKIDAELFDRIATERGYLRQRVDVAALLRIAARLDEIADYGSWQAETAGRIREAVEGAPEPDAESEAEPEVLGADGLPIRVGETVWYHDTCNANEFVVMGITPPGGYQSVRITLAGSPSGDSTWVDAPRLTHTPPNIQARIDKNAKMHPLAYCRYVLKWNGEDVKCTDDVDCGRAMVADLLRCQRELDARTMGGDAR